MPRLVTCPGCERSLAVPRGIVAGDLVGCPQCRHEFRLGDPREAESADAPELIGLDTASGAESVFDFGHTSGSSAAHARIGQRLTEGPAAGAYAPPAIETSAADAGETAEPPADVAGPPLEESVGIAAGGPAATAGVGDEPSPDSDVVLVPEEADESDADADVPPPLPRATAVTGCPNCWRQVGLASGAAAGMSVECPLCGGTFELRVIQPVSGPVDLPIARLAEAASVTARGARIDQPPFHRTAAAHESADAWADVAHLADLPTSDSGVSIANGSASAERGTVSVAPRPAAVRPAPNVALELLKAVAGGAVGIAVTYAFLMWGCSRDPFQVAPKLPRVLVPDNLEAPLNE